MELTGKIIKIFPVETGQSKAGKEWKKQNILIEHQDGNYQKKAIITGKSEPILFTISQLESGDNVTCSITIDAREWNERYFTDITTWKIVKNLSF